MFIIAKFLEALVVVLNMGLTIYMYIIIIRALISWVQPDPYNPIVQFLYRATEPVMAEVRKRMPDTGGIDLSPIVVLMAILFLQVFVVGTLSEVAHRLGSSTQSGSLPF